jgi:hypothetical protein
MATKGVTYTRFWISSLSPQVHVKIDHKDFDQEAALNSLRPMSREIGPTLCLHLYLFERVQSSSMLYLASEALALTRGLLISVVTY